MSFVVTGATGRLGRAVVDSLLTRGAAPQDVVATGRSVEKIADLADRGVRVEKLSFTDVPDGLLAAGDVLLLVSGSDLGQRVDQHRSVVEAAVQAGVARIVYTSAPAADDTTLILAPEHAATEAIIRESGLPFTFLRNGWYTENYLPAFQQAAQSGVLVASVGEARVSSAAIADYAEAAAAVLLDDGYVGQVLELSGDRAWDFAELAAAFADNLGREVTFTAVTPAEHRDILQGAGLDEGTAGFVVALDQNIADGLLGHTPGDLSRVVGHPTTPMEQTVASWSV